MQQLKRRRGCQKANKKHLPLSFREAWVGHFLTLKFILYHEKVNFYFP
jgi:hypothetical protein